jgi:hypothetical protein
MLSPSSSSFPGRGGRYGQSRRCRLEFRADDIRFLPDAENGGEATFSFHTWDQSMGKPGMIVPLDADSESAFGRDSLTTKITVLDVNDAPRLTYCPDFKSITAKDVENDGQLVSSVIHSVDEDAGSKSGVAIIKSSPDHGTWEYRLSTSPPTAWSAINVADETRALLLTDADYLRFRPRGEGGVAATIRCRAWDQTVGRAGDRVPIEETGGTSAFSRNSTLLRILVLE